MGVFALRIMGDAEEFALPELKGRNDASLVDVLEPAKDIGLLTPWQPTWYAIHPALPWFLRQLFARHYDGQSGESTAHAALQAWARAISEVGNFCMTAVGGNPSRR